MKVIPEKVARTKLDIYVFIGSFNQRKETRL